MKVETGQETNRGMLQASTLKSRFPFYSVFIQSCYSRILNSLPPARHVPRPPDGGIRPTGGRGVVPRPDGCPDAEVGRASRALACWVVTDAVTGSGGDRHRCVRRAGMLSAVVRRGVARATWLPAHAWCPAGVTAAVAGGCSFVHAQQAGPRALCSAAETEVAVEETGKKAAMKRWMQRRGVSVSDVPRVITTFYIAKNVVFVAGLGLCIKVQPLRRFFQSGRPQRLKLAFKIGRASCRERV